MRCVNHLDGGGLGFVPRCDTPLAGSPEGESKVKPVSALRMRFEYV